MHTPLLIGLLLMPGIAASCMIPVPIPGYEPISPAAFGRIVAADTSLPIAGAEVSILDRAESLVQTKEDGIFVLPPQDKWYLIAFYTPCPVYHFPPTGSYSSKVSISHPDYQGVSLYLNDFRLVSGDSKATYEFDTGDISLLPIGEAAEPDDATDRPSADR